MTLYGYWRSSSSWRVRIALHYKALDFDNVPVHLVRGGGEQLQAAHLKRNPMGQVPVLEVDGVYLGQSLAILEYLEEQYPMPALLPATPMLRARARRIAEVINSSVQPQQNLSLVKRLHADFGVDKADWMCSVIQDGMDRLERSVAAGSANGVANSAGPYLVGDGPSFAEVCLIPQLFNARRWGCNVSAWPTLLRAESAVQQHPAFLAAHPDRQPDAQ